MIYKQFVDVFTFTAIIMGKDTQPEKTFYCV